MDILSQKRKDKINNRLEIMLERHLLRRVGNTRIKRLESRCEFFRLTVFNVFRDRLDILPGFHTHRRSILRHQGIKEPVFDLLIRKAKRKPHVDAALPDPGPEEFRVRPIPVVGGAGADSLPGPALFQPGLYPLGEFHQNAGRGQIQYLYVHDSGGDSRRRLSGRDGNPLPGAVGRYSHCCFRGGIQPMGL